MDDETPNAAHKFALRDASAALIIDPSGQLLMQQRDNRPEITYPGYWALFGGGIDEGEDPLVALKRELYEELELAVGQADFFTTMSFTGESLGLRTYDRHIYAINVDDTEIAKMVLHEGADMQFLTYEQILHEYPTCPNDAFAVWLYRHRNDFSDLHDKD